jgi:hypothetical protein
VCVCVLSYTRELMLLNQGLQVEDQLIIM